MLEKIDCDSLKQIKKLANGSYAEVILCTHAKYGKVAVKKFGKIQSDDRPENRWKKESSFLQNNKHKNIIKLIGTTEYADAFGLVMEYAENGNLEDFLHKNKEISLSAKLNILHQIAVPLVYLHKGDFVHSDLKPQNILRMANNTVKLSDFGSCASTKVGDATKGCQQSKQCTVAYAAPEFLENPNIMRSTKEDVYGFSMLVYEVITMKHVWEGAQQSLLKQVICDGRRPDEDPLKTVISAASTSMERQIYEKLVEMVKKCWDKDPSKRPHMKEVMKEVSGLIEMLNKDQGCSLNSSENVNENGFHNLPTHNEYSKNGELEKAVPRKRIHPASPHAMSRKTMKMSVASSTEENESPGDAGSSHTDLFYKVIEEIPSRDWKEFCRKVLNLPDHAIDEIEENNLHNIKEQKYQMLLHWKQMHGETANHQSLLPLCEQFKARHKRGDADNTEMGEGQKQDSTSATKTNGQMANGTSKRIICKQSSENDSCGQSSSEQSLQILSLDTNGSSEESSETIDDPLVSKIKQCLNKYNQKYADKEFWANGGNSDVHPKMYVVPDYYEMGIGRNSDSYQPSNSQKSPSEFSFQTTQVVFDQLLERTNDYNYTAITGPPGSGKTTCSIQLAMSGNYLCFFRKFMHMNYPQPLSLKQFVVNNWLKDLTENEKKDAFEMLISKPEKCMFVFDGYDQAVQKLEQPSALDHDTTMPISQILASLCRGDFLPGARVIITSRAHAINDMPESLRPKQVIIMQDLSDKDAEKLFSSFSNGGNNAMEVWGSLKDQSPQLFDLCHNVLMLKLCAKAMFADRRSKFKSVKTMTGMLLRLLQLFRRSEHSGKRVTSELFKKLSELAYVQTDEATVVITKQDLEKIDLCESDVQDLVISVVGEATDYLFEGDELLFFVHQTWQEILAAIYCCYLPMDKFQIVTKTLVPNQRWCMVRRFLCGLLLDSPKFTESDVSTSKKSFFLQQMLEVLASARNGQQLIEIFIDVLEMDSKHVKEFADFFPQRADFSRTNLGATGFYALSRILEHTNAEIYSLDLRNTYPSVTSLSHLSNAMEKMRQKIQIFDMSFNLMTDEHIPVLQKIIPHVQDQLRLAGAFKDAVNGRMVQPNFEQRYLLSQTRNEKNSDLEMWRCSHGNRTF